MKIAKGGSWFIKPKSEESSPALFSFAIGMEKLTFTTSGGA